MVISPWLLLREDVEFETLIPSFAQSEPSAPKSENKKQKQILGATKSLVKVHFHHKKEQKVGGG